MFRYRMNDEKWERKFRGIVENAIADKPEQVVVPLPERSRKQSHGRVNDAVRIMATYGYELRFTQLLTTPSNMASLTPSWGALTFSKIRTDDT